MSLADDIRDAVAIAHEVTLELQPEVQWIPWVAQTNEFGRRQVDLPFGETRKRPALVEERYESVTVNGNNVETYAKLYFIQPLTPVGSPGRVEPVDTRDIFIMPNGRRGHPVHTDGFTDKGTGLPYINIVWLGKLRDQ